jgi:hypothetical protein
MNTATAANPNRPAITARYFTTGAGLKVHIPMPGRVDWMECGLWRNRFFPANAPRDAQDICQRCVALSQRRAAVKE